MDDLVKRGMLTTYRGAPTVAASVGLIGLILLLAGVGSRFEETRGERALDELCTVGTSHPGATAYHCPRGRYDVVVGEPRAAPSELDEARLTAEALEYRASSGAEVQWRAPDRVWCRGTLLPQNRSPGCVVGEVRQRDGRTLLPLTGKPSVAVGLRAQFTEFEAVKIFEFAGDVLIPAGAAFLGLSLAGFALTRRSRHGAWER